MVIRIVWLYVLLAFRSHDPDTIVTELQLMYLNIGFSQGLDDQWILK